MPQPGRVGWAGSNPSAAGLIDKAHRCRKTLAMAYDEELADRVRAAASAHPEVSEKKMFGGLSFLRSGNMAVGASGQGGMMVRVGEEAASELLELEGVEQIEMRGRPMRGWVRVATKQLESQDDLVSWVERGMAFAAALPAKQAYRAKGH